MKAKSKKLKHQTKVEAIRKEILALRNELSRIFGGQRTSIGMQKPVASANAHE